MTIGTPIIEQLIALAKGAETDDYGRLRPTREAVAELGRLLHGATIVSLRKSCQIPSGCVSTDSEGGVQIEWLRRSGCVRLVVPASKDLVAYVYHEVDNNYATEDATPERLAYWLRQIRA